MDHIPENNQNLGNLHASDSPLIEARHLKKYFPIRGKGELHAVDDVSFSIYPGETLGLVGESGCGKSTVGNVVMRLLSRTSGELLYRGEDVFQTDKQRSFELRKRMQIIFQDPYSSINPRHTIRTTMEEAFSIHKLAKGKDLNDRLEELCEATGLNPELLNRFPHELDGGNRQIVGIARALSLDPEFIVCDEPVSSLDVSVQAKIINRLMDLQKERGLSYLFVSHDLSVVRHISHRIAVMYLGQIVEMATSEQIFEHTMHPYSIALLSAVPKIDFEGKTKRIVLKGDVPSPLNPKPGCRFAPRCWMAQEYCKEHTPELVECEPGHCVACHFAKEAAKYAAQEIQPKI